MAIVSFEQIAKVYPEQSTSLDPLLADRAATPMGPTSVEGRPTLYDPLWGYFQFNQDIGLDYGQSDVYESKATFTITGVFTKDATLSKRDAEAGENSFLALTSMYETLRARFDFMCSAQPPTNAQDWYGPLDPRVIALPLPLLDEDGNRVYARGIEFTIEPGQFPIEIRYRATLEEVQRPYAQLLVNGQLIDDAVLQIEFPRPLITRSLLVGGIGEAIQIENYSAMEVQVSGIVPIAPASGESFFLQPSGHMIARTARQAMSSIQSTVINLSLVMPSGSGYETVNLYQGMTRIPPTMMDFVHDDGLLQFSIRCRE